MMSSLITPSVRRRDATVYGKTDENRHAAERGMTHSFHKIRRKKRLAMRGTASPLHALMSLANQAKRANRLENAFNGAMPEPSAFLRHACQRIASWSFDSVERPHKAVKS